MPPFAAVTIMNKEHRQTLLRGLRDAIPRLESGPPGSETRRRANEEISKNLQQIKALLYGDGDPLPEVIAQLAQETYTTDLLHLLVQNIVHVVQIFNNLLRRQIGTRWPTVEYLSGKPEVVFSTLAGYENEEIALNTGMILKEMLRHEQLAKILLYSDKFYNKNYDRFFSSYTTLILSENYVTKRQSLKLLGEILLDRANFNMMMNLLRDKSKNIQFEAFHVFKVFVANPKKPPQIENILRRNQEKLLVFLKNFHNDKEDEQFSDEKQFLIVQIQGL
ncbi:Mo25-like protein [Gymnopus androsaceus JB14]|uniref:Mo25-like protein n=1 Tax=Gymnopus androsaceus JB14 TaxID=1447944 RepID=A0A6A4GXA6_9AGAR|nr:Mo25-like protein [Gymnopus androsaceus JB14]